MEAIGKVIGLYEPIPERKQSQVECVDSESQTKDESVLTSKEVKKRGYKYTTEPKPPIECNYCGEELYPRGLIIPMVNRVLTWIEHERCTCKAATKYWDEYDREQEAIKARQGLVS